MKASDYLWKILKELGVSQVFCVAGGASAHLLDSLRASGIPTCHMHHEQACAMAADAYYRIAKKPAVVLTTNGPGATNAITGVMGAWQDSIPIIVISGQVPTQQQINNQDLRQVGVQEANIIDMVRYCTNFSQTITRAYQFTGTIQYALEAATQGRMGPAWIEIPLDIQCAEIEEDWEGINVATPAVSYSIAKISRAIKNAKRPLIIAGNGIHLANAEADFLILTDKLQIPFVCTWSAVDLIHHDDALYMGNFGILGQRAANLAVQNADLLLILGSRLSIPNIGYKTELFSPDSFKIMVDIEEEEITKSSLDIDMPVVCDAKRFIEDLLIQPYDIPAFAWTQQCLEWRLQYPISAEPHTRAEGYINSYDFIAELSKHLTPNDIVVTDMGTAFTCTHQAMHCKGNRLITSPGLSSMGFGLPGAIGAWFADPTKRIILIAGDGGMQMNIQELQTVKDYDIPLEIHILDSNGYLAISIMQDNLFNGARFGSEGGSPHWLSIAEAYGVDLHVVHLPPDQKMMPRVQSTKDSEGNIVSGDPGRMWP